MDVGALLNLILGQGGALVLLCIGVFFLYRENLKLRDKLDLSLAERLRDLKDAAMVANAYVELRKQDKGNE